MKAQELRIGNWFIPTMFNGVELEERPISAMEFLALSENPNWGKPIPLTEERLLKFGFEKDVTEYNTCWFLNHVYIWFVDGEYINELDLPIKYVHQLQNLYFALKGEELTLKEDK
jgi:hypothetical protein